MRLLLLTIAVGLLEACDGLPTPKIPQVDQAMQATHGGGERLRAHQRCVEATSGTDDLVRCMGAEGYHFVARAPGFPADECWALRDSPDDDTLPPPHCFEHAADAPH